METEVRLTEGGHEPWTVGSAQKLRECKEMDSLPEPPEGKQPYQLPEFRTSDLQDCKRINPCGFDTLGL